MKNLVQYGSFLVAVGCRLNYDTESTEFDIAEYPKEKHKQKVIQAAIEDIAKFLDTANRTDGMAAIALADFVDGNPNPLIDYQRRNILNALGIKCGDQFISTVMMQARVNRSWHTSEVVGTCSFFGEICTHRGINFDPKKRGIRSTRNPQDYHVMMGSVIKREQLITPSLDAAYLLIPEGIMVSPKAIEIGAQLEQQIEQLHPDKLDDLLGKLTKRKEALSVATDS